eukprot:scaffold94671_cov40-Prasinocladus_malaysianus.AAC.1
MTIMRPAVQPRRMVAGLSAQNCQNLKLRQTCVEVGSARATQRLAIQILNVNPSSNRTAVALPSALGVDAEGTHQP